MQTKVKRNERELSSHTHTHTEQRRATHIYRQDHGNPTLATLWFCTAGQNAGRSTATLPPRSPVNKVIAGGQSVRPVLSNFLEKPFSFFFDATASIKLKKKKREKRCAYTPSPTLLLLGNAT